MFKLTSGCFGCPCAAQRPVVPICARVGLPKVSQQPKRLAFDPLRKQQAARAASSSAEPPETSSEIDNEAAAFCIIESRESVKNFANMQLDELKSNIQSRRNKIFLLMEEVRRLRIQQRLKGVPVRPETEDLDAALKEEETYPSFIPLFPPITEKTLNLYINFYIVTVSGIILFGALIAPSLEIKLGVGGTSYNDFIAGMGLPSQLADVDPIVASFCGGAVGVLTSLLLVEANNAKLQAKRRCIYCEGSGYLTCGACMGTGSAEGGQCSCCSGTGKVMCTACLCTGKQLATEHDPRVDPFTLSD